MLILTRRVGETLMVGDDVTVTVLGESEDNLSIVDGVVRVSDDVALSKLEI